MRLANYPAVSRWPSAGEKPGLKVAGWSFAHSIIPASQRLLFLEIQNCSLSSRQGGQGEQEVCGRMCVGQLIMTTCHHHHQQHHHSSYALSLLRGDTDFLEECEGRHLVLASQAVEVLEFNFFGPGKFISPSHGRPWTFAGAV